MNASKAEEHEDGAPSLTAGVAESIDDGPTADVNFEKQGYVFR